MKNFVYYGELYSIYGFLLTDKQKEIFSLYYEENLSLSEIAEYKKVSKSYVGKLISDVEKKLNYYEDNLHHYELLEKTAKKNINFH
ncbi:MAG: DNA-binding protein [Firmicutes bacterium]|nr:DNA-binding protein [Bacillota bacterium]